MTSSTRKAGGATGLQGGGSQTLARGIQVLEFLAGQGGAVSIPDIVAAIGLHRSIIYRLLRTLEQYRLVTRDERGLVSLGPHLAALASSVERDLQSVAAAPLRSAAEELGATCFLVELDQDEAVTLMSIEPRRSAVTVAQRPGTSHPLGVGAPGRAVLAQWPRVRWPQQLAPERVAATEQVLVTGFATSQSEVIPGLRCVAVPLRLNDYPPLAICVVFITAAAPELLAARLRLAATAIGNALGDASGV